MITKYKITSLKEIETSASLPRIEVIVEFYDNQDEVIHHNDFIMELIEETYKYIGPPITDDTVDPPNARDNPELFELNDAHLPDDIIRNIENYIGRTNGRGQFFDHRSYDTRPPKKGQKVIENKLPVQALINMVRNKK